jgi:DNA-binding transcriptional LysR family regulator
MSKDRSSRLEDMVVFAQVVETGSLAQAARALGSTRSAVSKAVARLERHLGTRLLHRTTRHLSPTAAGHACYGHCARISAEAKSAERAASEMSATPHGRLRVTCALSLASILSPVIPGFGLRYPEVSLELALTDAVVDIVREGYDVGIRLGRMPDSSLVARKILAYRPLVCASPKYLAKHRAPKSPAELEDHACLLRIGHEAWRLGSGESAVSVRVSGRFYADTPEPVRQAALAGLGIALLPSFVVEGDIASGALVSLLEPYTSREAAVVAVYPNQQYLSPNVRAFIDFLVDAFPASTA